MFWIRLLQIFTWIMFLGAFSMAVLKLTGNFDWSWWIVVSPIFVNIVVNLGFKLYIHQRRAAASAALLQRLQDHPVTFDAEE
jgi:hypothetical protein